jgi:dCTP deaminase
MILSDKSIESYINSGKIIADPLPDKEQIQPASLDVRLGEEFANPHSGGTWKTDDSFTFDSGHRYLAHTKETIGLPNGIAAQLAGRSTIGRQGIIVHKTAGWIDPGFTGEITLEIMNLGRSPVTLQIGQRVAQLVFFKLDQPSSGYEGHYQNQKGATEPK